MFINENDLPNHGNLTSDPIQAVHEPKKVVNAEQVDKILRIHPVRLKAALEQHYSPRELGERWELSPGTIRSLFESEPGVIRIDRPEQCHKRKYRSMRIPESVAARVHQRLAA
jgi:hypothetical protein